MKNFAWQVVTHGPGAAAQWQTYPLTAPRPMNNHPPDKIFHTLAIFTVLTRKLLRLTRNTGLFLPILGCQFPEKVSLYQSANKVHLRIPLKKGNHHCY